MGDRLDEQISGHYGWSGLMEAIADELRAKGIDPERVTVAQLASVDNYHWHRLAGTLALAHVAKITTADRVLDVGGGIGGPARQLAYRLGATSRCSTSRPSTAPLAKRSRSGPILLTWCRSFTQMRLICRSPMAPSTSSGPSMPR